MHPIRRGNRLSEGYVSRILVVAPENPFPPDSGGRLRTHGFLQVLAATYSIDLLTTSRIGAKPSEIAHLRVFEVQRTLSSRDAALRSLYKFRNCSWFSHLDADLAPRLSSIVCETEYEFVLIENTLLASLIPLIKRLRPNLRIVVNAHNFETKLARQIVGIQKNILKRCYFRLNSVATKRDEKKVLRRADCILTCSENDAREFRALSSEANENIHVVPNFIDARSYLPSESPAADSAPSIAFIGDMQYWPNVNGATFFYREIFPEIRQQLPDTVWYIVGRDCHPSLRALVEGDPSVIITGYVHSIVNYVARCGVVIVPLLEGSGTRLKILEAWAIGRAVISTSIGCQGLNCTPGTDILVADTPHDFAQGTLRLLREDQYARNIADNARTTLLVYYDRDAVAPKLMKALGF